MRFKTRALAKAMMKFRAPDGLSYEERVRRKIRRAPGNPSGDFDEFTCAWNSMSGPKLTAGLLRRLTENADSGAASEQALLYRSMLEKEPAIAAHLQTRILSVLSCDWSLQGDDPAKVHELTGILEQAGIHRLLRHLLDALAFGYSGAAIIWEEGGKGIQTFRKIHTPNWTFDRAGNPALIPLDGQPRPLSEYHPNQFVLHTHKLQSGPCQSGGLLRPLLWLYFFKHYAMRDRARYLEKFGIPFLIAKIREDDFENESVRASILSSLTRVGSDGAGVITEGSELQVLSPAGGSTDYQNWMNYIDKLFALLILGQTASSADASGFSRGQIQENVRRDILEADCRALMSTVTRQILNPLERFRFGSENTVQFNLDYSMPENLTEKADIVKTLAGSGFRINPRWVEKTFSIELEKDHVK